MAEMPDTVIREQIAAGSEALGATLAGGQLDRLARLVALLAKWNRAYNLTAVVTPQEMVTHHILDSLAILPWLRGDTLLDVGTGAGLPALVLAIARPRLAVTGLDAVDKKLRFVRQAAIELGLENIHAEHARVEQYRPDRPFAMVVSRAVGRLAELYGLTRRLLAPGGCWLFMKGRCPEAELAELAQRVQGPSARVERLEVPGLGAERHLIILEHIQVQDARGSD
ncbi:MAG TPA: 16S rRNA (guanine(527)-N(7))-methyltransferase RsmG [Gammaproteobacteria bacterium]|nr:16S rRNA (guanine(527)-N(7))-methyltransferase RsmG [Gammaproteobacteria bacterium]